MRLRKFKPCQIAVMDFSKKLLGGVSEVKLHSHLWTQNSAFVLIFFQQIFSIRNLIFFYNFSHLFCHVILVFFSFIQNKNYMTKYGYKIVEFLNCKYKIFVCKKIEDLQKKEDKAGWILSSEPEKNIIFYLQFRNSTILALFCSSSVYFRVTRYMLV